MPFQGGIPFFNDAVGNTVIAVKANGFAQIFMMKLVNTTAAAAYLQIFAKPAASVTLGTTVPDWVIRLGANETTNPSDMSPPAMFNGTGLSIAGTTTPTGNTAAVISASLLIG